MLRRGMILGTAGAGACLTGAAALAACGPQQGGGPGAPGAQAGMAQSKAATVEYCGNPPLIEGKNFQMDVFDASRQKYANIKINYGATKTDGQGVEAVDAITAAIVAGNPPNFVRFDRFQSPASAAKGVWVALDELMKKDKFDTGRFAPLIVPEAKGITDGKWYALIQNTDNRLV